MVLFGTRNPYLFLVIREGLGFELLAPRHLFVPRYLRVRGQDEGLVQTARKSAAAATVTIQKLRGNVSVLMGAGGNIAVLPGRDGKVLSRLMRQRFLDAHRQKGSEGFSAVPLQLL